MTPPQFWKVMKRAVSAWVEDYAPSMGAALSYYMLFSVAPLLVIVIAVAGFFFGADAVRGEISAQLSGLVGKEGATAIEQMLESANKPKKGAIAALVSVFVLVLGATTVLGELQNALDRIWRAPAEMKKGGIFGFMRSRLLSIAMILGIAFLLMVSLVVSAGLAALGKWWGAWFRGWELLAHAIDLLVSFGMMTVLFALIYKIIPRVHIRWRDVWIGAAVTAMLFAIGKVLIGLYLGKSDVTSGFGAAGSLVLVMVWVYYSAQIFLIGAEYTWIYAHEYGSRRGTSPLPLDSATPIPQRPEGGPKLANLGPRRATMDTWQFYQNDSGEWCWKHVAATGVATQGEHCYMSRTDCIADAMRNGYLARPSVQAYRATEGRAFMPWL